MIRLRIIGLLVKLQTQQPTTYTSTAHQHAPVSLVCSFKPTNWKNKLTLQWFRNTSVVTNKIVSITKIYHAIHVGNFKVIGNPFLLSQFTSCV